MLGKIRESVRGRVLLAGGAVAVVALLTAVLILAVRPDDEGAPPQRARLPSGTQAELGLALEPLQHDAEGVPVDAHFVFTSLMPMERDSVAKSIRVTPEAHLEIAASSPYEFHLVPREALQPGAVYRFTFAPPGARVPLASWAFQVKSPLRVVQTLPSHEANNVPIDSGIEITFSHDNLVDPQSFVEITPLPEGHFELRKRTLVFVPRQLQPETLYTVRVRPGIKVANSDLSLADDLTFQFETGSGSRASGPVPGPYFAFMHKIGEWGTRDAPIITIQTSDTSIREVAMEVFAYPSLDAFVKDIEAREQVPYWAQYTRNKTTVDTGRLALVSSFTAAVEGSRRPDFGVPLTRLFVRMPDALSPGYYLLQTMHANAPVQAFLQITDLGTYLAVSESSTLVWVNDVSTGQPVSGAAVRLSGGEVLGRTDGQGVSQFATPSSLLSSTTAIYNQRTTVALSYFTVTDAAGRAAVVPLSPVLPVAMSGRCGAFTDYAFYSGSSDYWSFLVADRPLYKPDDVVRFWGVAIPRDSRAAGGELVAELTGRAYEAYEEAQTGPKVTLQSTDWGTFTGEYSLSGVEPGYYTLSVRDSKGLVSSASFQVANYVKPAYQLSVRPARPAYFSGEQVDVSISAAFFDGTPLPGLDLQINSGRGGSTLTTGPDGRASLTFTAAASDSGASLTSISVSPAGPEQGEVTTDAYVAVFPAAVQLEAGAKYESGTVFVDGRVMNVDPSRFENIGDVYGYGNFRPGKQPAHLTGPAAGQAVRMVVTPRFYEAVEVGERYDFVNKVSRKVYRYQERDGTPFEITTVSDAAGRFSLSFPAPEGSHFQLRLESTDSAGRTAALHVYAAAFAYGGSDIGGIASISIGRESESFGGFFGVPPQAYEIGQEVAAVFRRGNTAPPSGDQNRYLFYEGQRGIRHYQVQDNPEYRITFGDRHVPSAAIRGVYFNGFTYVEAQYGPTIVFNPASRELSIQVRSLQESYEPGTEASVEVQVRDAAGRPAQAEVNLAAVDEALFAVRDFNPYSTDILGALYRQLPPGIVRTYASHQYPPEYFEVGGRGGDGGVREDFADVAYYGTVRTDASGRARVSFKLPDNVTSWRVTAYGFTKDLKAGSGRGSVVATLPFIVDVTLNDDYLVEDKPIVRLRSFGSKLEPGARVQYRLSAPSLAADEILLEGGAFEEAQASLPRLTLGRHAITVRASAGALEDAVVRQIEVVEARLMAPRVTFYEDVSSGARLQGSPTGRTTVTFIDGGRGQLYQRLLGLRFVYGDRVDQALARVVADRLLADYFGETAEALPFNPDVYIRAPSGYAGYTSPRPGVFSPTPRPPGVSILPYSDGDIAVTARVAALAPDLFGRERLRGMLMAVASDHRETPERVLIALYGLAALGEPVLLDLQALEGHPDLTWRGRLYLALGLHARGDDAGALRIFEAMMEEAGEDLHPWTRLRAGDDEDDSIEATALAALLAIGLRDSRAESLMRYVQENYTRDTLLYLEELQYLQEALPRALPTAVSFRYEAGGRAEEVVLERGATKSLSLTAEELAGLGITVREGRLAAVTRYSAPAAAGATASPDISVRRTILVGGRPAGIIPASGLVQVKIEVSFGPQAPDGCYQVTDFVPSGLKVVTKSSLAQSFAPPVLRGSGPVVIPYLAEPQKISFCVGKGGGSYSYYARPSQKGEYVWEPAAVHNQRAPAVIAFSDASRVVID
ncbi:MAG TPA: Ig-like domain-containing protein [Dehalococcoidia bacterium]|nr:Ig-like domain-containing protein [Dehalococcoidia bacterium]